MQKRIDLIEEDTLDFEGNAIPIGDPTKVTMKGAPKQNTKVRQEVNHPVSKNCRPLAYNKRKKQG
jgi:hypothetical protein